MCVREEGGECRESSERECFAEIATRGDQIDQETYYRLRYGSVYSLESSSLAPGSVVVVSFFLACGHGGKTRNGTVPVPGTDTVLYVEGRWLA